MPELRQNMVTKDWVIIATERARRPEAFRVETGGVTADLPEYDPNCPFCPGNEHMVAEEVLRDAANTPHGWALRVVKNKYPALSPVGDRVRTDGGIERSLTGVGYHEVLIETPRHNTGPAEQSDAEVIATLAAFQRRGNSLRADPRIEHLICFKNHGAKAGSSLPHPHGQLIALPVVPHNERARNDDARRHFDDHGRCVVCEMLDAELRAGDRIVLETEHMVAFVPYAAYSPFHMWIVPRRHQGSFLSAPMEAVADLGRVLRNVLRRLHVGLGDPAYNYVIRSAPLRDDRAAHLHWYMAIVPRVSQTAGFELGTGMFINTALPEASAEFLRTIKP